MLNKCHTIRGADETRQVENNEHRASGPRAARLKDLGDEPPPAPGPEGGKQIERASSRVFRWPRGWASKAISGSGGNFCGLAIENCSPMQKSAATLIFKPAAKLFKLCPAVHNRGSPFRFKLWDLLSIKGRATSPFFEVRNLMKKLGSALTWKFVALG